MIVTKDGIKYDNSPGLEERGNLELADDLTDSELDEAINIIAPLSKGVMIVTGAPRSGKDLFGNVFSWKLKNYFKNRKVLRDEIPREPYGEYELFNPTTLAVDLGDMEMQLMEELENNNISRKRASNRMLEYMMSNIADQWLEYKGNDLLRDAVIYLTEFSGYMYNRAPFNPMNVFLSRILRRWGHYDLLVIGTTQQKAELDKKTCLPFVTHEVRCRWSKTKQNVGLYNIYRTRMITKNGALEVSGKRIPYMIDGGLPRERLDGLRYFDIFNSKSAYNIRV